MDNGRAVRSGIEISMSVADLLEQAAPADYNGMNRTKTILKCNDVLQNRADMSIDTLCELLAQKCGPDYSEQLAEIKQDMQAFFHQRMLRTLRYTMVGEQTYHYRLWDFDPEHPLKIIDQKIFDHAAEHGFPPNFFTESYFDHVTVYCMPDGVDCSSSRFQNCRFFVCGIRGAVFDNAAFYDSDFHSVLLQMVNFTGTSIAHSHFRDSDFVSVSFQDAQLNSCQTLDCSMERVDFQGAVLNGSSFGRVNAQHVLNLHHAVITQGGATRDEIRQLRTSTFRELGVPMFPEKQRSSGGRRKKVSAPER